MGVDRLAAQLSNKQLVKLHVHAAAYLRKSPADGAAAGGGGGRGQVSAGSSSGAGLTAAGDVRRVNSIDSSTSSVGGPSGYGFRAGSSSYSTTNGLVSQASTSSSSSSSSSNSSSSSAHGAMGKIRGGGPTGIGGGSGGGVGGSGSGSNTTAHGAVSSISDAKEQAEILRLELDRLQTGITLLGQSLDRLGEVVRVDTHCCGGLFDAITSSVRVRGSAVRKKGGYDRVDGFVDNSLHSVSGTALSPTTTPAKPSRPAAEVLSSFSPVSSRLHSISDGDGNGGIDGDGNGGHGHTILGGRRSRTSVSHFSVLASDDSED